MFWHYPLFTEIIGFSLFQKLCAEALAESDQCSPINDVEPANVGEEMEKFAKTRYRTPLLTKLFMALKTIPPSSIWTSTLMLTLQYLLENCLIS